MHLFRKPSLPVKRVLVINGSPRRNGNVSRMLDIMATQARSQQLGVDEVFVDELSFTPCRGCMACRKTKACALPADDATRVAQMLCDSELLIIGSPCYWADMNGKLKMLLDRLVYVLIDDSNPRGLPLALQRQKRAVLVTACTTPFPFSSLLNQSTGTLKALKRIVKSGGYRICATLQKTGTRQHGALTPREQQKCKHIIEKITNKPFIKQPS